LFGFRRLTVDVGLPPSARAFMSFVCQLLAIICDSVPLISDPIPSASHPFACFDLPLTPYESLFALIKRGSPAFELIGRVGAVLDNHSSR
jgi:hypothetical protein